MSISCCEIFDVNTMIINAHISYFKFFKYWILFVKKIISLKKYLFSAIKPIVTKEALHPIIQPAPINSQSDFLSSKNFFPYFVIRFVLIKKIVLLVLVF